jgi:hypothetical protein
MQVFQIDYPWYDSTCSASNILMTLTMKIIPWQITFCAGQVSFNVARSYITDQHNPINNTPKKSIRMSLRVKVLRIISKYTAYGKI